MSRWNFALRVRKKADRNSNLILFYLLLRLVTWVRKHIDFEALLMFCFVFCHQVLKYILDLDISIAWDAFLLIMFFSSWGKNEHLSHCMLSCLIFCRCPLPSCVRFALTPLSVGRVEGEMHAPSTFSLLKNTLHLSPLMTYTKPKPESPHSISEFSISLETTVPTQIGWPWWQTRHTLVCCNWLDSEMTECICAFSAGSDFLDLLHL